VSSGRHHEVAWLDVAVHNADRVRGGQPGAGLLGDAEYALDREHPQAVGLPLTQHGGHGHPLGQLHHHEQLAADTAGL
jgi:hypothetical protein